MLLTNTRYKIVGLTGHMHSGKSTIANSLVNWGFHRVSFASPIKRMALSIGMSQEQVYGSEKETPIPWLCNMSSRKFQQLLGTEFGRNMICKDVWVNIALREINAYPAVVVDDVRFLSEAEALKQRGALIVKITRPGCYGDDHASEKEIDLIEADVIIENTKSIDEAVQQCILAIQ